MACIDKEHAKEYKRCRAELKKRSTDTLRLQKKAKKGQSDSIQSLVESSMHDITQRKADLEEVERRSLRAAMIEERTRYCTFVSMLQPVVQEEFEVMYELGHLQEAMETITNVTKNPSVLPQASEELIMETKTSAAYLYPESPGGSHGYSNSLGSRKSSVCSISSINSSGSSNSPGHVYQRSLSQVRPTYQMHTASSNECQIFSLFIFVLILCSICGLLDFVFIRSVFFCFLFFFVSHRFVSEQNIFVVVGRFSFS